jgi:hypothetical protein
MTHETAGATPEQIRGALVKSIEELPFHIAGQSAYDLAEHSGLETDQGKFALAVLLHTHLMLEPILPDKTGLKEAGFFDVTGGPEHSRHIKIDEYGKRALEFQAQRFPFSSGASIRVEETQRWTTPPNGQPPENYVVMDPLDESSSAHDSKKPMQSAGIIITDRDGHLLIGGIANLVGKEIILIEKGRLHIFAIPDTPVMPHAIVLKEINLKDIPQFKRSSDGKIHYAMLGRRIEGIGKKMFYHESALVLDMFGGYGIHKLLDGTIDALVDPIKGQPWYEAVIWGWIAREMGYAVIGMDGKSIDFQALLLRNNRGSDPKNPEDLERVKIIIAKTPEIAALIRIRLSAPTVYPFGLQTYL